MEQVAIEVLFYAQNLLEMVGTVIVPFEVILLMLVNKRWFYGDTDVNLMSGFTIWAIYIWHAPFSILPLLEQLEGLIFSGLFGDVELSPQSIVLHILVGDCCYYWSHRLLHTRICFALDHGIHHSSRELNFTTNMRHGLFSPLYGWLPLAVPVVLGFHPLLLFAAFVLANAVPILCHIECVGKLGWLEKIFNTPSHHRVHHGRNPQYIDKNFAGMFIIWDRLFGTFAEEVEPVKFGVNDYVPTRNLFDVYFSSWKTLLKHRSATPEFDFDKSN